MDGVEVVPPSQSTICWNGIGENNEEVQEFGLQLGAKDDGNGIGSADLVLGGGGEWKTSGENGSNFNLHFICDTEFLYCYAAGILVMCNEEKCGRLRG